MWWNVHFSVVCRVKNQQNPSSDWFFTASIRFTRKIRTQDLSRIKSTIALLFRQAALFTSHRTYVISLCWWSRSRQQYIARGVTSQVQHSLPQQKCSSISWGGGLTHAAQGCWSSITVVLFKSKQSNFVIGFVSCLVINIVFSQTLYCSSTTHCAEKQKQYTK